ncbi:MAG TPA: O-antigen ligase family protein [Gemmatimonadaceae bacterium]
MSVALPPEVTQMPAPAAVSGQRFTPSSWEPQPSPRFWRGVGWSPAFIAFLVYIFVIVSYRLNVGTAAMIATLTALVIEPGRRRLPVLVAGAVALLGWSVIGYGTTAYPEIVRKDLIEFGKICLVTFAAVNLLRTPRRLRFFVLFYLAVFGLFPVRGALFNYFVYGQTEAGRIFGSFIFQNPNDLAAFLLLTLSLVAGVFSTEKVRWLRWSAIAGAATIPLIMVLSQSRGGFLGLITFVLMALGQRHQRLRKLGILAVVTALVLMLAPESAWERLGTLRTPDAQLMEDRDEGSARQRWGIWRVANTIATENPVLGVGLGAYPQAHNEYSLREEFDPFARGLRDAHSTYLTLMAETGYLGFAFFVLLVLGTVIPAERTRRRAAKFFPQRAQQLYYMEAGLLAYGVAGIFGSYGVVVFTYLHLALIYAAAAMLRRDLSRLRAWKHSVSYSGNQPLAPEAVERGAA